MTARDVYRFGTFALDVGDRRLCAASDPIRLAPKAFDVLTMLVQHPGRLTRRWRGRIARSTSTPHTCSPANSSPVST